MSKMIRFTLAMLALIVCTVALTFGADPTAVVVPAVATPAAAAPSILDWFQANEAAIFAAALAVSEMLALIPGFAGNGVIDTCIKALKLLSGKADTAA